MATRSYGGYTNFVDFFGNEGNDYAAGTGAANTLYGGGRADRLLGNGGDDIIIADYADLTAGNVQGDDGLDALIYDSPERLVLDASARSFEIVRGGAGNDRLYVSTSTFGADGVMFLGADGSDSLSGADGSDFLIGGAGADTYSGGHGDDFFSIDASDAWTDIMGGKGLAVGDTVVVDGSDAYYFGNLFQQGIESYFVYDTSFSLASRAPIPPTTGGDGSGGGSGGGSEPGGDGGWNDDPGDDWYQPPVVLDLDDDGFELISANQSGIYFDWNEDGVRDETGWAAPDDGFLVIDRDGDGDITHADEISFGVYDRKGDFVSDLEGLRVFDTNGNGSLDAGDQAYGQFGVWQDSDSDALVDDGELRSLEDLGLEALSMTGYETGEKLNGRDNHIYATTDAVFSDGSTIKVADVLIGYDGKVTPGNMDASLEATWGGGGFLLYEVELPQIV